MKTDRIWMKWLVAVVIVAALAAAVHFGGPAALDVVRELHGG